MKDSEKAQRAAQARLAASAVETCATSVAAVVLVVLISGTLCQAKEPDAGIPGASELPEGEPTSEEAEKAEEGTPGDSLPGKFSGSVALTSNYVDRGISNSDNNPAIQGTLGYELETGVLGTSVYVQTFGSSVRLAGDRDTAHVELDAFFGIKGQIGETGVEWDLGGAYYSYPGASHRDNFNYWEIPLIFTYAPLDWLELQVSNWATPEYQFNTETGNYSNGTITVSIPNPYVGLKAFAGVGYQYVDKLPSGTDWTLGATATIKGVDFTVAYTDTNYRHRADACGGNNLCDAKVVFTVGAGF